MSLLQKIARRILSDSDKESGMQNYLCFPPGHFYSPITDGAELRENESAIWDKDDYAGIDFNEDSHRELLQVINRYAPEFQYPAETPADPNAYFTTNGQFMGGDALTLYALLRHWQPKRIIETGSGFSSLLMADVNNRPLGGQSHITCIEPYPRPFLIAGVPGIQGLIQKKIQDVPLETFDALEAGDIFFVDTSHICKTGSDVNHIYFKIFPRLKKGVYIHVHDIFFPNEYPRNWVIDQNRSWNEQYLLRALLMYSTAFKVLFGCSIANERYKELLPTTASVPFGGGGSIWMVRQ